jgi:hypothetical protein
LLVEKLLAGRRLTKIYPKRFPVRPKPWKNDDFAPL